jgi:hypothetical protein
MHMPKELLRQVLGIGRLWIGNRSIHASSEIWAREELAKLCDRVGMTPRDGGSQAGCFVATVLREKKKLQGTLFAEAGVELA